MPICLDGIQDGSMSLMKHDDLMLSYLTNVLAKEQADTYLQQLINNLAWQQETLHIFGRAVTVPRLVAWYGDPDCTYTYSGVTHQPLSWLPLLSLLKRQIEKLTSHRFNSVLANYYRDGNDYMGWHSDNEIELGDNPVVASLSLGAARKFLLRHQQSGRKESLILAHGSLLVMHAGTQEQWQHSVPKSKKIFLPRINLTFRWVNNH